MLIFDMDRLYIFKIIKEHYKTFYDANIGTINERIIDIRSVIVYQLIPLFFLILPALYILCLYLQQDMDSIENIIDKFITSSITAISIFAPLMFSTLILIFDMRNKFIEKLQIIPESENNTPDYKMIIKKIVLTKEMFSHICFTEIICITILLLSFLYILIPNIMVSIVIMAINSYLILLFFETLFIIMKRLFNLIYY